MAMTINQQVTVGYGFETLSVADSIQVLTPALYKDSATSGGALAAFISLETGSIRYRYDSGNPSSTVGHLLQPGGTLVLLGQNQMSQFKCIRSGSTSGTISVTYERV